jgi:isoamylase
MSASAGSPHPLGATWTGEGVNFAVFSRHAERIELCIHDAGSGAELSRHPLDNRTGDVWHVELPADGASPGTLYSYRAHGPFEPHTGHRFDAGNPLIDPYAQELVLKDPPLARVRDGRFDWQNDRPPSVPWRDSFIYELHVKGYTRLHPQVPPELRGTYLGLACEPVLAHLKRIGVTAVELLPVQAFLTEGFLRDRGLTNYWGYNPIAWFAPAAQYALRDPVDEFKAMVKALHSAGIEVILDVVFNHTAEGSESGRTLSLRGFDNSIYYRLLREDKQYYENLTGCGNTVNCQHPRVQTLIVDCLRYWADEMHVDGFRFDLAPVLGRDDDGFNDRAALFAALRAEPSLAYVKMIAEPWDIGLGGYQLGRFPRGWSEWNDRYRDNMRAFWRGDSGKIGEFAERLAGSSDIFRHRSRKPSASINFITSHDGFTLRDLVSYDNRRNEDNLENGADGHSHNLSWNCGIEGETDDPSVVSLRLRQMKNFLATLFLSQGVPMMLAGDEFAHTQRGNNNAYCQDNEISWIDWSRLGGRADLVEFVGRVSEIRRTHPEFRRETFLKGARRALSKDVSWLSVRGGEMTSRDWHDAELRALGIKFAVARPGVSGLLALVNSGAIAVEFPLPTSADDGWRRIFDTSIEPAADGNREPLACFADGYRIESHSMALLEA